MITAEAAAQLALLIQSENGYEASKIVLKIYFDAYQEGLNKAEEIAAQVIADSFKNIPLK